MNILVIGHRLGLHGGPIYWSGHSVPRDQCRGNTLSNNIFSTAQNCENLNRMKISSILMLLPSCIEESGSKCGDRFVCCQTFLPSPVGKKRRTPNWKRNIPTLEKYLASRTPKREFLEEKSEISPKEMIYVRKILSTLISWKNPY